MFIAKHRDGADGMIFPMEIDLNRIHMKVLKSEENAVEFQENTASDPKKQLVYLKKKYDKLNHATY